MFIELLQKIAATLESRRIPYMVIGGQAVLLYGEPRLTKDIDITIGLEPREGKVVLEAVAALGFRILVDDVESFLQKTFVLPVGDPASGLRVDLIFSLSEYERGAISRARLVDFPQCKVRFICPEDLVIYKVVAGRPRDIEDVRGILLKMPGLNHTEIVTWLREYDAAIGEDFEARWQRILDGFKTGGK